jgi:hypothetical protein
LLCWRIDDDVDVLAKTAEVGRDDEYAMTPVRSVQFVVCTSHVCQLPKEKRKEEEILTKRSDY